MNKRIIKIGMCILFFFSMIILFSNFNVYGFSKGDTVVVTSNGAYHYSLPASSYAADQRYKRGDKKFEKGTILEFVQDMSVDNICQIKFNGKLYYIKKGNISKQVSNESASKSTKQKFYDSYYNKELSYYKSLTDGELLTLSEKWHTYNKMVNPTFTGLEATAWTNINNNINTAAESKGREIVNGQVKRTALDTAAKGEEQVKSEIDSETVEGDGSAGITTASEGGSTIYKNQPKNDGTSSAAGSLDDVMSDADSFIDSASTDGVGTVQADALQDFSQTFYNILLAIGVVVAVIVGMVIGIKFMTSSVEEKADIKELLVPYVVGCIVVFGGFAIWKIVVTVLQGM